MDSGPTIYCRCWKCWYSLPCQHFQLPEAPCKRVELVSQCAWLAACTGSTKVSWEGEGLLSAGQKYICSPQVMLLLLLLLPPAASTSKQGPRAPTCAHCQQAHSGKLKSS